MNAPPVVERPAYGAFEPEASEHNRDALARALARLRGLLERHIAGEPAWVEPNLDPEPAVLARLCRRFSLSAFERDLLLLAAGVELDAGFASLCAAAQGGQRPWPTFSLALAALPDAHWSALAPDSPLRAWSLLELGEGAQLTTRRLVIAERILHHLLGLEGLEARLAGLVASVSAVVPLSPRQAARVPRLAALIGEGRRVRLVSADRSAVHSLAALACASLGLGLFSLRTAELPVGPEARAELARLLRRECRLAPAVLLIEVAEGMGSAELAAWLANLDETVLLTGAVPAESAGSCLAFELPVPDTAERLALWREALGFELAPALALASEGGRLATQYDFGAEDIRLVALAAREHMLAGVEPCAALWRASRERARGGLEELAQRIEPRAGWDELILPETLLAQLRELAAQLRHRAMVYETWGLAGKTGRGLGLCALFTGESGTGKTLAAEVLASELGLDLYRIDLSAVVSKYIGETEKNLGRVFDAAEASGAVLLFDEADALFGKRSEVRDSHDRYANIELAYLLQRMEAYRGLAILTTNLKGVLDTAFLRRIRFLISFPFPDAASRAAIWQRLLPATLPREELDIARLARLNIAGGAIRNIVLNAAFLAADQGAILRMDHVQHAVRREYAKLEKPLSGGECGGAS